MYCQKQEELERVLKGRLEEGKLEENEFRGICLRTPQGPTGYIYCLPRVSWQPAQGMRQSNSGAKNQELISDYLVIFMKQKIFEPTICITDY